MRNQGWSQSAVLTDTHYDVDFKLYSRLTSTLGGPKYLAKHEQKRYFFALKSYTIPFLLLLKIVDVSRLISSFVLSDFRDTFFKLKPPLLLIIFVVVKNSLFSETFPQLVPFWKTFLFHCFFLFHFCRSLQFIFQTFETFLSDSVL